MKPHLFLSVGLLLVGMLLLATPALAGGWAVITLDELPGEIIAGQPLEIGFMVRQHGVTPLGDLSPIVYARQDDLRVTEQATAQGETGHYVATLTFPQAGEWEWSIEAFTGNQPMPPLNVMATPVAGQNKAQAPSPNILSLLTGILGLAGLITGSFIAVRRKARWAIALLLTGLVLGAGSIVSAAGQPAAESAAKIGVTDTFISQEETGRQLFIAKGCMVCHSHSETNSIREFGVDIGPELTDKKFSPEYLLMWLQDPRAVKPSTQMPTLGLSDAEIEALIAFINAD